MRTQIHPIDATGRTIEGINRDWGDAIVLLSGDTFIHLKADSYPGCEPHFEQGQTGSFNWKENLSDLVKWGLCSVEEQTLLRAKFAAESALEREKQERAEFERLRQKFEGSEP